MWMRFCVLLNKGTCLKGQSFPSECFRGQGGPLQGGTTGWLTLRTFYVSWKPGENTQATNRKRLLHLWSKVVKGHCCWGAYGQLSPRNGGKGHAERPQSTEQGSKSWTPGGCGDFIQVQWKGSHTHPVFPDLLFFLPPIPEPLCVPRWHWLWAVSTSDTPMAPVHSPHPHADTCGPRWGGDLDKERSLIKEAAWELSQPSPLPPGSSVVGVSLALVLFHLCETKAGLQKNDSKTKTSHDTQGQNVLSGSAPIVTVRDFFPRCRIRCMSSRAGQRPWAGRSTELTSLRRLHLYGCSLPACPKWEWQLCS